MEELTTEILSLLLGPGGALVASFAAVVVLWRRCAALESELRAERAARLADAASVADRLLSTWGKVSGAIDTLERITSIDLPNVSVPPRGGA